jgi:phosphoribosyl 1,2-cyclic phosphodiesterase/ActR/RegA family two-component response regulator
MPPGKTVLLIDDDAEYRELLGELLRDQGWQVLLAEDGDAGVELAKHHRPDIVLSDLLMARCNGFQVCRTLRSLDSLRETKIVVTSGRDFESDRQAALAEGADEYLTKPINPGKLFALLTRLVRPAVEPPKTPQPAAAPQPALPARLRFWGVRGSIPTPGPTTLEYGGNTSCIEVRAEGQIIILDAGTGLRLLGHELTAEFDNRPLEATLLLTHTHWDHIQGLPFFLPVYRPQSQLLILGYEGARDGLEHVLSSQMENPFFPIGLKQVPANVRIEELKELSFHVGPVRVEACFANHPGICVGYRLFTSGGSIAFFPDNEPMHAPRGVKPTAAEVAIARESARHRDHKIIDFLRSTDVLIMDAQYDAEEYEQHIGWGHGCLDDVVALAIEAEVKRLFLFHHDPNHDDAKIRQMVTSARALAAARKSQLEIEAAREGLVVELKTAAASTH